ncbi:DMT family transporter [Cellulophaga fucicola]|uniref:DMT family transporter n=1 Tax=Cellulophaga fucicola TaxID=76595 RepID=UPI003EBBCC22
MNQTTFSVLAIIGGVFLAAQGALNSTLSVLLKNPLLASVIAFLTSTIFAIIFVLLSTKSLPNASDLKQIPIYLWFSGGLFSVLGISLYYYTIPKLGISTMISFGLFGQLTFSIIAGHFGWLNLPLEPVTFKRILGFFVMMFGIILINVK